MIKPQKMENEFAHNLKATSASFRLLPTHGGELTTSRCDSDSEFQITTDQAPARPPTLHVARLRASAPLSPSASESLNEEKDDAHRELAALLAPWLSICAFFGLHHSLQLSSSRSESVCCQCLPWRTMHSVSICILFFGISLGYATSAIFAIDLGLSSISGRVRFCTIPS